MLVRFSSSRSSGSSAGGTCVDGASGAGPRTGGGEGGGGGRDRSRARRRRGCSAGGKISRRSSRKRRIFPPTCASGARLSRRQLRSREEHARRGNALGTRRRAPSSTAGERRRSPSRGRTPSASSCTPSSRASRCAPSRTTSWRPAWSPSSAWASRSSSRTGGARPPRPRPAALERPAARGGPRARRRRRRADGEATGGGHLGALVGTNSGPAPSRRGLSALARQRALLGLVAVITALLDRLGPEHSSGLEGEDPDDRRERGAMARSRPRALLASSTAGARRGGWCVAPGARRGDAPDAHVARPRPRLSRLRGRSRARRGHHGSALETRRSHARRPRARARAARAPTTSLLSDGAPAGFARAASSGASSAAATRSAKTHAAASHASTARSRGPRRTRTGRGRRGATSPCVRWLRAGASTSSIGARRHGGTTATPP